MEVDFPVSDDDSIYASDADTSILRPPFEPVAITLTGPSAKELDKIMDAIEAEEMSSEEEESADEGDISDSDTSQALTDSIDPTSDDDMVDVPSKLVKVDDVDQDEQETEEEYAENGVYLGRDLDDMDSSGNIKRDLQAEALFENAIDHSIPQPDSTDVAVRSSTLADDSPSTTISNGKLDTPLSDRKDAKASPLKTSAKPPMPTPVTIISNKDAEPRNSSDDDDYMVSVPGGNQRMLSSLGDNINNERMLSTLDQVPKSRHVPKPALEDQPQHQEQHTKPGLEKNDINTPHTNGLVTPLDPLHAKRGDSDTMEPVTPLSEEENSITNTDADTNTTNLVSAADSLTRGLPTDKDETTPVVASSVPAAEDESDEDDFKDCEDVDKLKATVPPSKDKNANVDSNADNNESVDVTEIPLEKKNPTSSLDDVPDVEDIKGGNGVPRQADLVEPELDDSNAKNTSIGGKGKAPTASVVPDFPLMDEIAITSPNGSATDGKGGEKSRGIEIPEGAANKEGDNSNDTTTPASPDSKQGKGKHTSNLNLDEVSSVTSKTTLTEPLARGKSARKSNGALFSLSSFYRAFKKPSKGAKEDGGSSEGSKKGTSRDDADIVGDMRGLKLGNGAPPDLIVGGERHAKSGSTMAIGSSKWRSRKSEAISREEHSAREKLVASRARSEFTGASSSYNGTEDGAGDEPGNYLDVKTEEEKKEEERHLRLEETLKSQIATLRSARSGFVDLALLTPMTEKTLSAVEVEAKRIIQQMPEVEQRKEELARQVEILAITTEAELAAKEKTLVAAKIKVAEAKCELDKLRHELFVLKRELGTQERVRSGDQLRLKNRREKGDKDLKAAQDSLETMQRNLDQRKAMLKNYKAEVSRLEKAVQDLEGDWD